ncbi:MAG: toll/interleukin-1 receptor domain-containing protein [Chloroflexi bacterium]|nr:toll/interleukin-1 receptor domain-containing protein [Chloroflexota bacterium]
MADEAAIKSALGPKPQLRRVFISHAHSDRDLGVALSTLLEHAFSGTVEPYFSTDPSPGGGMQPVDEWYSRIHEKLSESESVWVLATAGSISSPWLYWEAGIGRAVCPGGIVVLRIGLSPEEIPSPLNAYQSYDGLSVAEGGVQELVGKIGERIGLNVQPAWLKTCASDFVEAAKKHEPKEPKEDGEPRLASENVSRIDGLVGRLEVATRRIEAAGGSPGAEDPDDDEDAMQEYRERLERITGDNTTFFRSAEAMLEWLGSLPDDADLTVRDSLDGDGDVPVFVQRSGESVTVYFQGTKEELAAQGDVPDPQKRIMSEIKALLEGTSPAE